jgi:heme/copper-type cytochrome/quinol oxidase subunit 1
MTGINYPEILGRIHFWITFVGVNITFFPMHFLGLAGMPRRIPDFPTAYNGWNFVASFGSTITLIGFIFFFFVIYVSYLYNYRRYSYRLHYGHNGIPEMDYDNKYDKEVYSKLRISQLY